ncbi:hypothetical protein D3A96_10740 [Robertkochia marina]|nr:hypothetical protein D3A96_10740 [Robertkochia marina]
MTMNYSDEKAFHAWAFVHFALMQNEPKNQEYLRQFLLRRTAANPALHAPHFRLVYRLLLQIFIPSKPTSQIRLTKCYSIEELKAVLRFWQARIRLMKLP